MHHMKVILIRLVKNMSHQKIYILALSSMKIWNRYTINSPHQTIEQLEVTQEVALPEVAKQAHEKRNNKI